VYVVKAHSVPVRTNTLKRLNRDLRDTLFEDPPGSPAMTWTTVASCDVLSRLFEAYLEDLRELVEAVAEYLRGEDGSTPDCMLRVLADSIVYSLRAPLLKDPLGSDKQPHYFHYLLSFVTRVHACGRGPEYSQVLENVLNTILGGVNNQDDKDNNIDRGLQELVMKIINVIHGERHQAVGEALFYALPGTPVPGYNASSGILSVLMATALATSALRGYSGRHGIGEKVEVVRLAALLYGLTRIAGLCRSPRWDVRSELRRLFERYLDEDTLNTIFDIIERVEAAETVGGSEDARQDGECGISDMSDMASLIAWAYDRSLEQEALREEIRRAAGKDADLRRSLGELARELGVAQDILSSGLYDIPPKKDVYEKFLNLLNSKERAMKVARLSELIVRNLVREGAQSGQATGYSSREPPCGSTPRVVVVDIGGVQAGLAEATRMRSLSGYSLAIDYLTLSIVPLAITMLGVGLESLIFAGGGSVQAIIPGRLEEGQEVKDFLAGIVRDLIKSNPLLTYTLYNVRIRIGTAPLEGSYYPDIVAQAFADLTAYDLHEDERAVINVASMLYGISRKCEDCGIRPATVSIYEGEKICIVCASRYLYSRSLGYYTELSSSSYRAKIIVELLNEAINVPGCDIETVIEKALFRYISRSGRSPEFHVMKLLSHDGNYAVVKSDGNIVGAYMSIAKTPSMYYERSVRLDMATKTALRKIVKHILSKIGKEGCPDPHNDFDVIGLIELIAALVYGFLYAGGDDSLLIVPAKIALPLAASFIYIFSAETGFSSTLSTGIVGAPTKHNLWWALDAATTLLDDVSKSGDARRTAYQALREASPAAAAGFVSFDYTDGWGLTSQRALLRHEYLKNAGKSWQPMYVVSQKAPDLAAILGIIADSRNTLEGVPRSAEQDKSLEKALLDLIIKAWSSNEMVSCMGNVRRVLLRVESKLSKPGTPDNLHKLHLAYLLKRRGEAGDCTIELIRYLSDNGRKIVPLHDVYLVYKFLRGD